MCPQVRLPSALALAVDVYGCGPDGCTLRGEGGECAAGEAVTILVSSSSGIDSSSCDVGGFSWFSLKLSYASLSSFTTGSMFVTIASWAFMPPVASEGRS